MNSDPQIIKAGGTLAEPKIKQKTHFTPTATMGNTGSGPINVDTFRSLMEKSAIPPKSSITIEGLFNEYFFDTGLLKTDDILAPSFTVASVVDPVTSELERYISVGLNCRDDGKNFRNDLNLVVVLDISGSMGSGFYNPRTTSNSGESANQSDTRSKIEVAKDVLHELVKSLRPSDRFAIVLFDDRAELLQPIRRFDTIELETLEERIKGIQCRGGTNMEIGFMKGAEVLSDLLKEDETSHKNSNRILFLTDAHPNIGGGSNSLINLSKRATQQKIYTTYIGVGLDFNTELVNEITKVRGSNYFSVHSAKQFKKILNDDFNYIVTPSAFGTVLFMESEAFEIEKVYGSPFADESTGTLMKIETVNASAKDEQGIKGGMVLIKLREKVTSNENPSKILKLTLKYETTEGVKQQNTQEFNFDKLISHCEDDQGSRYSNNGIRKAVLLTKYVLLLHNCIDSVEDRFKSNQQDGVDTSSATQPTPELSITSFMKQDVIQFRSHFIAEVEKLGDKSLNKELDILDKFRYAKEI